MRKILSSGLLATGEKKIHRIPALNLYLSPRRIFALQCTCWALVHNMVYQPIAWILNICQKLFIREFRTMPDSILCIWCERLFIWSAKNKCGILRQFDGSVGVYLDRHPCQTMLEISGSHTNVMCVMFRLRPIKLSTTTRRWHMEQNTEWQIRSVIDDMNHCWLAINSQQPWTR